MNLNSCRGFYLLTILSDHLVIFVVVIYKNFHEIEQTLYLGKKGGNKGGNKGGKKVFLWVGLIKIHGKSILSVLFGKFMFLTFFLLKNLYKLYSETLQEGALRFSVSESIKIPWKVS